MLRKYFTDHPRTVGESYGQHLAIASGFGISMVAGGLACMIHSIVPGWCESTASGIVRDLYNRMEGRLPAPAKPAMSIEALEWVI